MTTISKELWPNVEAEQKGSLGKNLNMYKPYFSEQEVLFHKKWTP